MKKILIVIIFSLSGAMAMSQEIKTLEVKDWNLLRKSGFYESNTANSTNNPSTHGWYWGINVGHQFNDREAPYHYNGQILFGVHSSSIPSVYVRSTNYLGLGTWAKVIHSKGDHAIDGKLTVKEVQITVNTGADFVFKPDYNLRPLSEVESFVRKNRHLPEIPSEKEMLEDGVSVNDLQIKLLQKVEELTLYMIEQEKRAEKQQKKIEKQDEIIKELQDKITNI